MHAQGEEQEPRARSVISLFIVFCAADRSVLGSGIVTPATKTSRVQLANVCQRACKQQLAPVIVTIAASLRAGRP